jgi:hypothetical protein
VVLREPEGGVAVRPDGVAVLVAQGDDGAEGIGMVEPGAVAQFHQGFANARA